MWIDKRKSKKDGIWYSFSYIDKNGKRVRLPKKTHPIFKTEDDARIWAQSHEAFRMRQVEVTQLKIKWVNEAEFLCELIKQWADWYAKTKTQNSYSLATAKRNLELYVFNYFVCEIHSADPINWHLNFWNFRQHLDKTKNTLNKPLAKNSIKNIIASLNSFIQFLGRIGRIPTTSIKKCEYDISKDEGMKDLDNIITPDEGDFIYQRLGAKTNIGIMWKLLLNTGMRINECAGLSMASVKSGRVDATLQAELDQHHLEYFGFIVLESQLAHSAVLDRNAGVVKRRPLKSRKEIHEKNNRIIPIFDKDTWNCLVLLFNRQKLIFLSKKWGDDKSNYLLFDDYNHSKYDKELQKAYSASDFVKKTWHCCRHTYATDLVGKTRSLFLARVILGHRSNAFERYCHIWQQMNRNSQGDDNIDFVV